MRAIDSVHTINHKITNFTNISHRLKLTFKLSVTRGRKIAVIETTQLAPKPGVIRQFHEFTPGEHQAARVYLNNSILEVTIRITHFRIITLINNNTIIYIFFLTKTCALNITLSTDKLFFVYCTK